MYKRQDVDDAWMERLFNKENTLGEVISEMKKRLSDGGVNITPVSYTHLDVYKRQERMIFILIPQSIATIWNFSVSDG